MIIIRHYNGDRLLHQIPVPRGQDPKYALAQIIRDATIIEVNDRFTVEEIVHTTMHYLDRSNLQ